MQLQGQLIDGASLPVILLIAGDHKDPVLSKGKSVKRLLIAQKLRWPCNAQVANLKCSASNDSTLADCRDNVVRSEALVPKLADLFKLKTGSKVPTDQAKLAFLFLYVGTSLAHGRG